MDPGRKCVLFGGFVKVHPSHRFCSVRSQISNAKVSFTPAQGGDGVPTRVRGPPIVYRDLKGFACCDCLTCKLMRGGLEQRNE